MVATFVSDLSSQASVRRLAAEVLARYRRLDVLVNNVGAVYGGRQLTIEGIELTWAVNHLAPFLLTTMLLDRLKESAPARIITTASEAHQVAHIPFSDLNVRKALYYATDVNGIAKAIGKGYTTPAVTINDPLIYQASLPTGTVKKLYSKIPGLKDQSI